ncbi:hypothetical protein ACFWI5_35905 [Streptomyces sp. NPDC127064]|uniref:hypothetical protein n=1 Tax=Streptomyces sp. NPDC127064 TaxID=3347124 RepID=UPI0036574FEC
MSGSRQQLGPGAEENPVLAASALAFTALQALEQALPEYRSSALGRLGRTEEAEAEARRAYKTEQGRRCWYVQAQPARRGRRRRRDEGRRRGPRAHRPAPAGTRLEQLREQLAEHAKQAAAVPWTDRLPELAARSLDGDTAGAVIA